MDVDVDADVPDVVVDVDMDCVIRLPSTQVGYVIRYAHECGCGCDGLSTHVGNVSRMHRERRESE